MIESVEIDIEAPISRVWRILTGFSDWPSWNRSVSRMDFPGPLEPGATFRWVGGGATITSRLEEVAEPTRLAWSGKSMGIAAVHVWTLTDLGEVTRVHTQESFHGIVVKLLPFVVRPMLRKSLRQGILDLKRAAESRSAGSQQPA